MLLTALISLILTIFILGLIFYLFWWAIGAVALGDPFDKIMRVVVVAAALIVMLMVLLGGYRIPLPGISGGSFH